MSLWFASGNAHKVLELRQILNSFGLFGDFKTPADLDFDFSPEENGADFIENALIKARALHKITDEPVLADDSGLCVDVLDGRPGIFSGRYGSEDGKKIETERRNSLLLQEVNEAKIKRNTDLASARFVCALVILINHDKFFAAQETLEGRIINETRGKGGFGYDPILFLPDKGATVAELPQSEKNKISHRGKAVSALLPILRIFLDGPGGSGR